MKFSTTLNEIRKHDPCSSGWAKLLKGLSKTSPDDESLPLERILEINGLPDALWALRCVPGIDKQARLFACECAQRVAGNNKDPRVQACIDVVRRMAYGTVTEQERSAAWSAAESAAESAARSAAESAAESAARSTAWSAAESAARSAAWSAAESAAWSAEQKIQSELYIKFFCTE